MSRDVLGQRVLSRDICSCPCPGTKGHRDKSFFCPGTKGQRDVPSRGNPSLDIWLIDVYELWRQLLSLSHLLYIFSLVSLSWSNLKEVYLVIRTFDLVITNSDYYLKYNTAIHVWILDFKQHSEFENLGNYLVLDQTFKIFLDSLNFRY